MWRMHTCDVMTGELRRPIDIPSASWSLSISDASLSTTRDKGTGEGEASSITVPWTEVWGTTARERARELTAGKRGIVLGWEESGAFRPVVFGAIGQRTDTALDTSFSLDSVMTLLSSRYVVEEGHFTKGGAPLCFHDLSLRAIAANVGWYATEGKPGGSLPIDWGDYYEAGGHERTYQPYNVGNLSCAAIFEKIANVEGGPDLTFRPYMADAHHVRLRFLGGSDADAYVGQEREFVLQWFHGAGSVHSLTVDHLGPVERVYATGAGSEEEQDCHLAEDLTYCRQADPWPLVEEATGYTDSDEHGLLVSHADGRLHADWWPMCQVTCEVDLGDPQVPRPGDLWPGDAVTLRVEGYPTLPDGEYRMRLMEMSGDLGTTVKYKFDPMIDPAEA